MSEVVIAEKFGIIQKTESELVHKSDVYFDFFQPEILKSQLSPRYLNKLRHGDVYIYLNQLILHDSGRWFRIQVSDIVEIRQITEQNQLIIKVGWFDLVLCCSEDGQLQAINNFLELTLDYLKEQELRSSNLRMQILTNGNKHFRKIKVKVPQEYSSLPT